MIGDAVITSVYNYFPTFSYQTPFVQSFCVKGNTPNAILNLLCYKNYGFLPNSI